MKSESTTKQYEQVFTSIKLDVTVPIIIRLDGNCFSSFTYNLNKPFDVNFSELMQECTKFALKETGGDFAYTQSDEISIIILPKLNKTSQVYHDGKFYKILSKLSSKVSVYFNKLIPNYLSSKIDDSPTFDCRAFNVPDLEMVFENLKDRFKDCRRNSISNAGYWLLGHSKTKNKNGKQILELLENNNINWFDYSNDFKYGCYFKRCKIIRTLTEEELKDLPKKHQARLNPNIEFERTIIQKYNLTSLKQIKDFLNIEVNIGDDR